MENQGLDGGLLLIGIILLHIGALMVRLFWFPRRKGKGRYCAKCNYLLDGITADRCPECGQFLAGSASVVRGLRVRRKGWAGAGLALFVLGVVACVLSPGGGLNRINWYAHKPTSWVISDLESAEPAVRYRAWRELTNRLSRNELSEAQQAKLDGAVGRVVADRPGEYSSDAMQQRLFARFDRLAPPQQEVMFGRLLADVESTAYIPATVAQVQIEKMEAAGALGGPQGDRLIEAALAAQAAPKVGVSTDWFIKVLSQRAAAGKLSDAQRERFFTQVMPVRLEARADVLAGDALPYVVRLGGRGPGVDDGWEWSRRLVSVRLDDGPAEAGGAPAARSKGAGPAGLGGSVKVDRPGDHALGVVFEMAAYRPGAGADDAPVWNRTVTMSQPFKVLPAGTANYVKVRDDPALADAVRRSLSVMNLRASTADPAKVAMDVAVNYPPVNVAFDVFVRRGGREIAAGSVHLAAGGSQAFSLGGAGMTFVGQFRGERADVIFRGSEAVARQTVDLYEFWKGEVVLKDVRLKIE